MLCIAGRDLSLNANEINMQNNITYLANARTIRCLGQERRTNYLFGTLAVDENNGARQTAISVPPVRLDHSQSTSSAAATGTAACGVKPNIDTWSRPARKDYP